VMAGTIDIRRNVLLDGHFVFLLLGHYQEDVLQFQMATPGYNTIIDM
jgi:hypothetical protein